MMIGLVSAKHCGCTTAALALAFAAAGRGDDVLVVEGDPAGGDLAAHFGCPLDPGLLSLAAAGRHTLTVDAVASHSQRLMGGVDVLFAPVAPVQAAATLADVAPRLGGALRRFEQLVIVDGGRWQAHAGQMALLAACDIVLVTVRPTVAAVEHVRVRLPELCLELPPPRLLVLGDHPYRAGDIEAALGLDVVGVLPWDPRGAHLLVDGVSPRAAQRIPLVRSARTLLDRLTRTGLSAVGADR